MLVTDEEAALAATLAEVGKHLGVTVVPIPRERLVERVRDDAPKLVVLDISPPDGLELLSTLKNGRSTADIPVVVISDIDDPELRELALDLGAAGFVARPLPVDLSAKLFALMGS